MCDVLQHVLIAKHETNSRRLAARVFMTDCMSTLFFKSPPQITAAELCGDLPCVDALFEASTLTEYIQLAASPGIFKPSTRSLKSLVSLFLDDDWAGPEAPSLDPVGSEHLISLIFGQLLFCYTVGIFIADI